LLCDAHHERFRVRGQVRPLSIETFVDLIRAQRELAAGAYVLRAVSGTPPGARSHGTTQARSRQRAIFAEQAGALLAVAARFGPTQVRCSRLWSITRSRPRR
jgi:negative regulator of replication initiation